MGTEPLLHARIDFYLHMARMMQEAALKAERADLRELWIDMAECWLALVGRLRSPLN
jgi:hypothetical protein